MNSESPAPAVASAARPAATIARILLVDDDPINQTVAVGLLRRRGFEAESAANGKLALEKLAAKRFDLIFMDLQMPELDGLETATLIRQKEAETANGGSAPAAPSACRVPIIALTTASAPGTREKCLAAGMDDYLTKPIIPREVFAMIEKYLGKNPG